MKKIYVFILSILFIIGVIGGVILNKAISEEKNNQENITNEKNIIKQKGEMNTRGLFDLGDGISNYEIDLMANDMTWNKKVRLHHKIITNMEEYEKYSSRIQIPQMSEEDFKSNFLLIIANENIRKDSERDLTISDVYEKNNKMYIVLKQKDSPTYNSDVQQDNNVFYAVVDNEVLRDNVIVKIENNY